MSAPLSLSFRAIPVRYLMGGGSGRFFRDHSIEVVINCFRYGVKD